jgi:hypothetical protein
MTAIHRHDPECPDCLRTAVLAARATLPGDLQELAARHHLGAWVNAVDDLAAGAGSAAVPVEVRAAAAAVLTALEVLGLSGPGHPLSGDVWREVPL